MLNDTEAAEMNAAVAPLLGFTYSRGHWHTPEPLGDCLFHGLPDFCREWSAEAICRAIVAYAEALNTEALKGETDHAE